MLQERGGKRKNKTTQAAKRQWGSISIALAVLSRRAPAGFCGWRKVPAPDPGAPDHSVAKNHQGSITPMMSGEVTAWRACAGIVSLKSLWAGRFRDCLSRQEQGLHVEQTLVGTADPGRGVPCEVGDAFSWKHDVNWVGSHLFQLEKEPIVLAALCRALGVQSLCPCRT